MFAVLGFFKPSWKKLGWFFVTFLVAQVYLFVLQGLVPITSLAMFVGFLLNPANILLETMSGIERELAVPFVNTINLVWIYLIATILAKEVSNDRE